jgi:capsular exopolysaccharide synthesis family protein
VSDEPSPAGFEPEVDLKEYLWVLRKRAWTVAAVLTVVLSLAAVNVFRQRPLYQAAARVLIEKEAPRVITFGDSVQVDDGDEKFYPTQYEILRSRSLAHAVVNRLRLGERAEFAAPAPPPGGSPPAPERRAEDLVSAFLSRVSIEPVRNTRLVQVQVSAYSAQLAAEMANALADAYMEQTLSQRVETTRQAGEFLSEQARETRRQLEQSEQALQRFNERNDIISLDQRQNLVVQKLEELSSELTRARTARIEMETRAQQIRDSKRAVGDLAALKAIPQVMGSTVVQQQRVELARLERDLEEQSKVYTPKHPKIIALTVQIRSAREKLAEEIADIERSIQNELQVAQRRERSLADAVEEQKKLVQSLNERGLAYGALKREVDTNRQIFETVMAREKETGIAGGVRTSNIRIVDRAEVPRAPVKPNKPRALLLALVVGLFGGVGLAFLLEYLDDTIKDPAEIGRFVDLPFLGSVPSFEIRAKGTPTIDQIVVLEPKSVFAEAFRLVRTSIMLSLPDRPPRTLAVTSPTPGEGKTVTAVNLAAALALAENRVLLVDADLRRPRLHKIFGVPNEQGLSSLVSGERDVSAVLVRTPIPNLMLMTAGPTPPNPSEMLGSARMGRLIELLGERFDRIVFDCTPTIPVADATVLGARVDGVVVVVRAGGTTRKTLQQTRRLLDAVQAPILGVVLNRVDRRKHHYSSPYYYHYYGE